ncbi:MAG: hypothetical protein ACREOW_01645 [Thermodesulfobacteriota bacterium]
MPTFTTRGGTVVLTEFDHVAPAVKFRPPPVLPTFTAPPMLKEKPEVYEVVVPCEAPGDAFS